MAVASTGYTAVSKESTFGTAITSPTHFYPFEEIDSDWANEFIRWQELRASRQAYRSADGMFRPSITAKGPLYAEGGLGVIFQGLTGGRASALLSGATVGFGHTFSDGALTSMTIERSDGVNGGSGILCERFAGCKVESVGLSAAMGEKVDLNVAWQAAKKPVTASAATPSNWPASAPIVFKGVSFEIDGSASGDALLFKTINMEFKNTLNREETLRATDETYKIFEGGIECTLSASMTFESLTMYNRVATNRSPFELVAFLTSTTLADADTTPDTYYGLEITWPSVRVAKVGTPFRAGEVISADVTFDVQFDYTANKAFEIVMKNIDNATAYST